MSKYVYYVYAYITSRGIPYYIGKGKGRRAFLPHGRIKTPKDIHRIIFLERNLSNVGACALERRYIRWYGRKNIDQNGILHNLGEGGEGNTSPRSPQQIEKLNEGLKKYWTKARRAEQAKKMCELGADNPLLEWFQTNEHPRGMLNKTHTTSTKEKISKLRANKNYEEIYGRQRAEMVKNKIANSLKGRQSVLKGRTYEEIHGAQKALELKVIRGLQKGRKRTKFNPPAKQECLHCGRLYDPGNLKRHLNRLTRVEPVS